MINLREIIGAIRDQLVLSEKVSRNKEDIEKVRTELKELENKVERLTDVIQKFPDAILQMVKEEMREFYEKEAAARKIALLELENKFLQQNRELPPGKKN